MDKKIGSTPPSSVTQQDDTQNEKKGVFNERTASETSPSKKLLSDCQDHDRGQAPANKSLTERAPSLTLRSDAQSSPQHDNSEYEEDESSHHSEYGESSEGYGYGYGYEYEYEEEQERKRDLKPYIVWPTAAVLGAGGMSIPIIHEAIKAGRIQIVDGSNGYTGPDDIWRPTDPIPPRPEELPPEPPTPGPMPEPAPEPPVPTPEPTPAPLPQPEPEPEPPVPAPIPQPEPPVPAPEPTPQPVPVPTPQPMPDPVEPTPPLSETPDALLTSPPELGETEAEEYALFKVLLEPYKDLSETEKQKAVLNVIQDRLKSEVTYGFDHDTEGTEQYSSSPIEMLADDGQGLDCEDYAALCERWAAYAKAEGYLPEDSNTYTFFVNQPGNPDPDHAIFVYESADIPPERYVIDTHTTEYDQYEGYEDFIAGGIPDANRDELTTLDEYMAHTGYEIWGNNAYSYDPLDEGKYTVAYDAINSEWLNEGSKNSTIADSISEEQLDQLRDQAFADGVPYNFENERETIEDQLALIEAQHFIGMTNYYGYGSTITADTLGLTEEQKLSLIGTYSEYYQRPFTAEDLNLTSTEHAFTHADSTIQSTESLAEVDSSLESSAAIEISHIEDTSQTTDHVLQSTEALEDSGTRDLSNMGFDLAQFDSPVEVASTIGSSILEGTLITAFAQKKLYTVEKRKRSIDKSYKVKTNMERTIISDLLAKNKHPIFNLTPELDNLKNIFEKRKNLAKSDIPDFVKKLHEEFDISAPDSINDKLLKKMGLKKTKKNGRYKISIDSKKFHQYLSKQGASLLFLLNGAQPINQRITRQQFKDYAQLCFLEGCQADQVINKKHTSLRNVLKQNKCFIEQDNLSNLLSDTLSLNTHVVDGKKQHIKESRLTERDIEKISLFIEQLQTDKYLMGNKIAIKKLNKILGKVGITLDYSTDKFLGSLRKSSKAIYHKIKIDKNKFYESLQKAGKLPEASVITNELRKNHDDITALHAIRDYDNWKIRQHKRDRNLKLASAVVGFLPVVDETLKAVAYGKETHYRVKNRKRANQHIDEALDYAKKSQLQKEELEELTRLLDNNRAVKEAHMAIKRNTSAANATTHTAAAIADPFTGIMGPVGKGITSGVRGVTKIGIAIGGAVDRHRQDKRLHSACPKTHQPLKNRASSLI